MGSICDSGDGNLSASEIRVRAAAESDLPQLTELYNYYVEHTAITFDVEPYTVERRRAWFQQFGAAGRHRLVVAERAGEILGYAGTMRFRPKAAYDTTVETTIYCGQGVTGQGVGTRLYDGLFRSLTGEDVQSIVAGYTLPNAASAALHQQFGFQPVGVFREVGRKFGRYWDVAWMQRPLRCGPEK